MQSRSATLQMRQNPRNDFRLLDAGDDLQLATAAMATLLVAAAAPTLLNAADAAGDKAATGDAAFIANAMKAAPKKVADNATIVAPDDKGAMRTLRKGSNAFTCMPDNPQTHGSMPTWATSHRQPARRD